MAKLGTVNTITEIVLGSDVDDTPIDGATTDPISSNWAYDHAATANPHSGSANTALSNLADVAINASLIPDAPGTFDLGAVDFPWMAAWVGTLRAGTISTFPDDELNVAPDAPIQGEDTAAGLGIFLLSSNAVAGTTNPGAAAGGSVNITAGDAARLTSGNANGGDVILTPGAGIGTGTNGRVVIGGALNWNGDVALDRLEAGIVIVTNGSTGYGTIDASSLRRVEPTAGEDTLPGLGLGVRASNAVAGTTNPGAAHGGDVSIISGNAARKDSGNGVGGNILLTPGEGVGTGGCGVIRITVDDSQLIFGGSATVGLAYSDVGVLKVTDGSTGGGAILAGPVFSVAASDATLIVDEVLSTGLLAGYGLLVVGDLTNGKTGTFRMDNQTLIVNSADAEFSITKDTGSKVNVYWDTDQYMVQNKTAGTISVKVGFFGV